MRLYHWVLVPDILRQCSGLEMSETNCPQMWHDTPEEKIPHLFDDLIDNTMQETYLFYISDSVPRVMS
jgi:hypothetical protein